jgi:Relaxase/Mobilisation nuclease domain
MPRVIDLGSRRALLDIGSYGRRAPGQPRTLVAAEVAYALRTARGAPEVVVKVSGGARTARGVGDHLDYIGRDGEQEIEMDDGRRIRERGFERHIIEDWDLDLEERKGAKQRAITTRRKPPKLVHNLVFSMPKGTPPEKLRAAVRKFAQDKFALRHRYLMTLHTDQPQPHVHLVVKAVSEQGTRLNIRKATLREWRRDFAAHLREQGVEANATERAVRGVSKPHKTDGIYRAALRGESTHYSERARTVADEIRRGGVRSEPGLTTLAQTREAVTDGWNAVATLLDAQGRRDEARTIRTFVAQMPPVRTEKQWIAGELLQSLERMRAMSALDRTR